MNLDERFKFEPNEEQKRQLVLLQEKFMQLGEFVNGTCPESRQKSESMKQLENAHMWANAALLQKVPIKEVSHE